MTDDSHDPRIPPPPDPSVLDYLKSRLPFGKHRAIKLPETQSTAVEALELQAPTLAHGPRRLGIPSLLDSVPWRSLTALGLALAAQTLYEPPGRAGTAGSIGYALAIGFLIWAAARGEWTLPPRSAENGVGETFRYRRTAFLVSLPLVVLAFIVLGGNLFTVFNVLVWLTALGLMIWSLWHRRPDRPSPWRRLSSFLSRPAWEIRFDRWTLVVLTAALLAVFFRLYALQHTPAEPFSDHAEKLLDVYDVSLGQTHIFFPRNTGREALQMYWTLLVSWIFGTGFSFFSLKLGTALIGLLTLPYVYRLGTEVGGRRVGLLALVLAGMAYWPNVISRVGLRFPLYPLFVAPLMFHLVRGFRRRARNDFIYAGVFLGLGMHGYSPFRLVPLLVVAAFALYLLHVRSRAARQSALLWLVIVALISLVVFVPLLRYASEHGDSFSYRALTRMTGVEQPLAGPWYQILLSNTWRALTLFNWDNGGIWVHSVPNRPALDIVSAALFLLGIFLLAFRYGRERNWQDIFLLVSIPLLLLPSILSLAFPDENPSLNRTGGALVPTFVVVAMALDGLITSFGTGEGRRLAAYGLTGVLLWNSAIQNYDLVFNQYHQNFRLNSWNSSEMGAVISQFRSVYGQTNTVWVVPFPHWVDTRLVGVWAGIPDRDFGLWADQLPETLQFSGPKLFMARANTELPALNDQAAIDAMRALYPQGSLSLHRSEVPGHDFWIYFVPALSIP